MEIFIDILLDAFLDSLKLLPFLFVTYLVMEWIEHKAQAHTVNAIKRAGAAGPAVGALLGAVPQCGFSAMASTFYAGRVVTLGTLFAVFLSTSDEMLPIFIAEQVDPKIIFAIVGAKVVIGMVCGFAIDAVMRATHRAPERMNIHDLCQDANCYCEERCAEEAIVPANRSATEQDSNACEGEESNMPVCAHVHHDHEHCSHEHGAGSIVLSAVKHTLQITLFVFIITILLNCAIEFIGEDAFAAFFKDNQEISIVVSALVGLIPNCAASVLIADLYVEGIIGTGAMMAGLLPAAGIGLLVLLRTNRSAKENVAIVGGLFAIGVVCGIIIAFIGL